MMCIRGTRRKTTDDGILPRPRVLREVGVVIKGQTRHLWSGLSRPKS